MSYEYEEGLPPEAKGRYSTKLNLAGLEKCPYKIAADTWLNDPKQWPELEYKDVYAYLIKSPRLYSQEAIDNHRSLDAHTFFVSGWVQTVHHQKTTTGNFVFRADVKPSWRVTEEPHHPWVTLKKTGPIINAHCDCMAGLGETCSHVGALLFKMEAAVRLGYTASACTDLPCVWNACFVQDVEPCEIYNIKFYKNESKQKLKKSKKKLKTAPAMATESEHNQFLESLSSLSDSCVGLSLFNEYADRFVAVGPATSTKLPQTLRNMYSNANTMLSGQEIIDMCDSLFNKIQVNEKEICYIEEATRNQSTSSVWHDQRLGRITASIIGDVLRTDPTNPAPSLVKKICVPMISPLNVPAIRWGNEHEEDAFRLYTHLYTNVGSNPDTIPSGQVYANIKCGHKDSAVNKSGLLIDREYPCIGASPDGIVTCECCGKGVLEIKCPYKFKEVALKDALKDTTFHLDGNFNFKKEHKYYAQVQTQMFVANASFADFVTWTPLDCSIVPIKRDEPFIQNLTLKIPVFWKAHILPELITRRLELKQSLTVCENKENHATNTFCLCKTTSEDNEMVACDHCDQWFHPGCLGLKKLPSAKIWYCPECKKGLKKGVTGK